MDRDTTKIAKKFSQKMRKVFHIERLILFGSRARGDNFITSDFDFIVVSSDFRTMPFLDRMPKIYQYWPYHYDIEPLCYTPEEFKRKAKEIGIVRKAIKEGKII